MFLLGGWIHPILIFVSLVGFTQAAEDFRRETNDAWPFLTGLRLPPDTVSRRSDDNDGNGDCDAGAICVGPSHDHYPLGCEPGVFFTARYTVPPLPQSHDPVRTTYYVRIAPFECIVLWLSIATQRKEIHGTSLCCVFCLLTLIGFNSMRARK